MMSLALMKRFFDTVSAQGDSPIANRIASHWMADPATVRVLRASANFVFEVCAPLGNNYILRFNHESERPLAAVEAELAFIHRAVQGGVRAARPIPSLEGRLVESVATELGVFHAVMFERIGGAERGIDSLDEVGFEEWGKLLARLHSAADGPPVARPGWRDHIEFARIWMPAEDRFSHAELEAAARKLGEVESKGPAFGLIHYDLESDNILWGETPGVIDFDDCVYYPFAADVAFSLRELWDDRPRNIDLADSRLAAFVRGYRSVRALGNSELERLPMYLQLHNLVLIARLARAISEPIKDPPEWATQLRHKLEGVIRARQADIREHPVFAN